jgi:hypothetical protein
MRMLEQGFGWDAAPDQARAAKRLLLFDHGNLLTELRASNCGDVPAGAGANDHDVIRVGHEDSFSFLDGP